MRRCPISSHTNYRASYADQNAPFFHKFFSYLPTLLLIRVRNPLSTWENRHSKFDYEFGTSSFHPRPYPLSSCGLLRCILFNGPGYTLEGLYISGTRLNNLDGDLTTTSCTPPFQMLDNRLAGACYLLTSRLLPRHSPVLNISACPLNPLRSLSTDNSG